MGSTGKIVTIFGATGNQGGAVARSLLRNPEFRVRAITRNPSSEHSKALRVLGAEVIRGDGFKPHDMEAAFKGSWGAFININSDDKASLQRLFYLLSVYCVEFLT
jgi:uncharacterized protein YbjT (DUF2867 family)